MINIKENEDLSKLNHSCAHLLAQAVKHLYPNAKFWVGPVIEEGFYYDIDLGDDVIKEEDLPKIEKEMKKLSKDGKRIVRHEISKDEALEMFHDDQLVEWMKMNKLYLVIPKEILLIFVVDHMLILLKNLNILNW